MRLPLLVLCLGLVGCQSASPVALTPSQTASPLAQGTLSLNIRWPARQVQVIPTSTETIRLRILKGGTLLQTIPLSRPSNGGAAQYSLQMDADSGLTVTAEAFRTNPVGPSDVPIASASAGSVSVIANQKTPLALILVPVFTPTLSGFSPSNGGPGVEVTLTGSFSDSGYYGMGINGITSPGSFVSSTSIRVQVPAGATSGAVTALDDGVPSAPGSQTFHVLTGLRLSGATDSASVGQTIQFQVPTGTDTASQSVSYPTLTTWEVVDPTKLGGDNGSYLSSVGSINGSGLFTAQTAGTAWVRVWSGSIQATASVTIH